MKLSQVVFGAAVATLVAVPSVHAQSMYGANGCWGTPSQSLPSGTISGTTYTNSVEGNCATDDSDVRLTWTSKAGSQSTRTSYVGYQRNTAFGGPTDGSILSLTPWEGTVGGNQYQVFNLGTMTWSNGNASTGSVTGFNSNFNLRLFLSSNTSNYFDYTGAVVASVDNNGNTRGVTFDWASPAGNSNGMSGFPLADGWRYFEADGKKYQFRVLGFDTGSSRCGDYSDVSQFSQSLLTDDGDTGTVTKNICGKIEYVGNVPGNPGTQSVVPEPSTYALMTAGLAGLFGVARRRRKQA